MRKHGFESPFNAMQITTWILLPLLILHFLLFVSPILPIAASVICTLIFCLLAFVSAYYAYLCCMTDPVDLLLYKHLNEEKDMPKQTQDIMAKKLVYSFMFGRKDGRSGATTTRGNGTSNAEYESGQQVPEAEPDNKFCWVCQTNVREHAMHCKYCDKCVSHFDHHCQWLNTCVGEANYPLFYGTVLSTFLFVFVDVVVLIGVTVDYFANDSARADDWLNADAGVAVAAINIFFLIFNFIMLSMIGQLLVFHWNLQRNSQTTYEFIVEDSAKKRITSKDKMARRALRVVAIGKAKRDGRRGDAFMLQLGGMRACACIDPFPKEEAKNEVYHNGSAAHDLEQAETGSDAATEKRIIPKEEEISPGRYTEETKHEESMTSTEQTSRKTDVHYTLNGQS